MRSNTKGASEPEGARERIRTAAIELVAERGVIGATVRAIATRAEVPIGLINYHFGSKDGLLEECDQWLMDRSLAKEDFLARSHPTFDVGQFLGSDDQWKTVMAYYVERMRTQGPAAQKLFDLMVKVTERMLAEGAESGAMRQVSDLTAASAILVAYSAGASIFGRDIARQLGGADLLDRAVTDRYARSSFEIFTHGLFTSDPFSTNDQES